MRKEIICYVTTNEEGEEISVQRVSDDPTFVLLRIGQTRLVINKSELVEAIGVCDMYGTLFDQEQKTAENKAALDASRAAAAAKGYVAEPGFIVPQNAKSTAKMFLTAEVTKPKPKKASKMSKEEEGTIVMDVDLHRGPTASELELAHITRLMNGPSLEVKDDD